MISLTKINKIFSDKHQSFHCLKDIDLTIDKGEFTVIAGPSGSGKSTLLNIIGLLDKATSGTYLFDDLDVSTMTNNALADIRREKIGFVFQAYNLMPVLTALENTEMIMEFCGLDKKLRRQRAMETLTSVGLADLKDRFPAQLSGGQQQRVAVARAIAAQPLLVVADEPTANLDSHSAENLLNLMVKLNHDLGITFLFSSHDQRVIQRAQRVLQLQDGQIVSDERKDQQPKLVAL
ncbi:ABC transporter ATP-binding protein [Pseudoalteromonas tunicata]|uniref:DppB n=2 Tax=Pseudoalteromonas tunicata D2 TaxID=87626 RepID=Q8RTI7_9GAMM|nr:ABC transporter ATP-binding protein [Pseudoalteromonas tunicata]AAL76238.1 DppB [Pseudoalteromonas tunicata]ATC95331.1 putative ABC transport system ATP-binding protein [Pseudoalteromonas tunicata]AXT30922.1 ABC transporter ATP-binding protein [Pseudoalteromonas tunicata]MDP4982058.1 ABC transporter ATP-binding protein [Pseudoalteromonas tunicata]MDP5213091.1 ABC transporter ATP-binding protein [Pseudoalteromonas tunicata]